MKQTQLDRLEKATSDYTLAQIEGALIAVGTWCKVFRKKKERATDNVYGVHGGSELSRLPSTSIYDQPIIASDLTEWDIEESNQGVVQKEHEDFDIILDNSFEEVEEAKILLNSFQWRSISTGSDSFLEDTGYAFVSMKTKLVQGDILVISKNDQDLKFKIYYPEYLGNRRFMVYRFRLTNVQE